MQRERTFGVDGAASGMDRAKLRVFQNADEVGFSCLMKGYKSLSLEAKVVLVILSDFLDHAMEGRGSNQQVSALLITSNLTQGNSSRTEAMGLLNSQRRESFRLDCWAGYHRSLASQHHSRHLSSSGFARCLLRASHRDVSRVK